MAIGHIVTLGFGNGTFAGSIGKIVTLGYGSGAAVAPEAPAPSSSGSGVSGLELVALRAASIRRDDEDIEVIVPVLMRFLYGD